MVAGGPWGTPAGNTLLLAIGTGLASVMGTTGAAMVLIHPLLRANAHRGRKVHLVVFFILLVANVGGSLSPLGDPPLFLGFLKGVPFFWPTTQSAGADAGDGRCCCSLAFWLLDRRLARRRPALPESAPPLRIAGLVNIGLLVAVVGVTALAGGLVEPARMSSCSARRSRSTRLVGMLALLAHRATLAVADPAGAAGPRTCSPGRRSRRWRSCSPPSSSAWRRWWRCCDQGEAGPFAWLIDLVDGAGRQALAGGLFLG